MKSTIWLVVLLILVGSCTQDEAIGEGQISYRITLESVWSPETHPNQFPLNAEVSPFLAVSHEDYIQIFDVDQLASPGIKALAETGSINPLDDEINDLIEAERANDMVTSTRIASPGIAYAELNLDNQSHYVSLVAKINPSPDWFIAVQGIDLVENGQWVDSKAAKVVVYDAGTDLGNTYTSIDNPALQPLTISEVDKGPITNAEGGVSTVAIVRFERVGR